MDAREIARQITLTPEWWLRFCTQLRRKDGSLEKQITPNKLQLAVLEYYLECLIAGKACLIMILKPRQKGASTIAEAVIYHHMRRFPGLNGALMGDIAATSDKVFEMFRRFYESDTYPWGQGLINQDENLTDQIKLPNGSTWYKETAGSTNAGRSGTIQVLHMDEVAFFQTTVSKDPTTAVLGSFYKDGPMSLGFATSTANGASGWFYTTWNGDNAWKKIFAAWFEFEDSTIPFENEEDKARFERSLDADELSERKIYNVTLEQLQWRRHIINTDYSGDASKFRQEMPSNAEECLTAETRVGTSKGMVRICDVEEGARSDHGTIVAKKSKGVRPVFKLTTRMGYTLRGTDDHRIALAGGGFCGLAKTVGLKIKLQPPVLADAYHVEEWTGFAGVRHSLRIDERWGELLGYFMGDGCFDNDSMELVCAAKDADVVASAKATAEDVWQKPFRSEVAGSQGGAVRLRASDTRFAPILERLGCVERAVDKRPRRNEASGVRKLICVPECIWRSPRAVVAAFLRGLFEADGWSNPDWAGVKFFTYRPGFMRDVQRLLLAFGIHSTVAQVTKTRDGKTFPGEEMRLGAVDAARFHQEIGFLSARKSSGAAASHKPDGRAKDFGMVDEVASVVPDGYEEVWDIQIEGEPVFSANGILVHNCFMLSSRPRFDMAAVKNMIAAAGTNDYRQRGNLIIQGDKSAIWLPDHQGGSAVRLEEPIIGCRYLVSVDTCTGEDQQISGHTQDPDYHDAQVWRQGYIDPGTKTWRNPMIVAWHNSRVDTDVLAEIVAGLSFYYGKCLTVPEVNGMGGLHVVKLLLKYGVPVFRRKPHTHATKQKTEEEELEAYGWNTDMVTRKWIIDALVPLVRQEKLDIFIKEILDQFRTFVVNKDGKSEAMPGKKDDSVMSAAIGVYNLGAATEYKLARTRGVDLMRLARDPRYLAPDGFRRKLAS